SRRKARTRCAKSSARGEGRKSMPSRYALPGRGSTSPSFHAAEEGPRELRGRELLQRLGAPLATRSRVVRGGEAARRRGGEAHWTGVWNSDASVGFVRNCLWRVSHSRNVFIHERPMRPTSYLPLPPAGSLATEWEPPWTTYTSLDVEAGMLKSGRAA